MDFQEGGEEFSAEDVETVIKNTIGEREEGSERETELIVFRLLVFVFIPFRFALPPNIVLTYNSSNSISPPLQPSSSSPPCTTPKR